MKYLFVLAAASLLSVGSFAQGKGHGNGHGKVKVKENKMKEKDERDDDRDDDNDHGNEKNKVKIKGNGNGTSVSGVPAKVQQAFARDYGNVSGVNWSKSRGNWTASYNGGLFGGATSIATYHANGARVDTRTNVPLTQIPQPVTIWQQRSPSINIGRIVRIDLPGQQEIYQVTPRSGNVVYLNRTGTVVTFNPR